MTKSKGVGRGKHSHGMTHHPAYRVWAAMLSRCTNPKDPSWPNYGERGLTPCDEWRFFSAFWDDMGPTWAPGLTLERIDNNKGYSLTNCRWEPQRVQTRNKRTNKWIDTPIGKMVQRDVELKLGLARATLSDRRRRNMTLLRPHEIEKLQP